MLTIPNGHRTISRLPKRDWPESFTGWNSGVEIRDMQGLAPSVARTIGLKALSVFGDEVFFYLVSCP